ncbi:NACHT domain-containing NTPase [Cyanobacterium aponinum FACHB-4101]|uniref:NACHT C-terminal helical domain 2-containing protein n=1 Tax=Cyanobacterium aponinum TaxID=379064 RepID=UPI0016813FE8|nr:NACHT domain-containing protein [Cyanobacterium aponinum]MBD2395469.1 NACHT domain-containing NTPase [Cyanobacterium aponinum FACHB-4101]
MTKRSLKLSIEGKQLAEEALAKKCLNKSKLAQDTQISESTINKFFQPHKIDKENFANICNALDLDIEKVIDLSKDIEDIFIEIRNKYKSYLINKYDLIKVLEMSYPIPLNQLYTNVNILEKITANQRKNIKELNSKAKNNIDRLRLSEKVVEKISGLDAVKKYNQLIILGKPGSGKTTFLKYITIQSISENFLNDFIPVFISLKDFAELENNLNLCQYITQLFTSNLCIKDSDINSLLALGKLLILLDGLDEIKEQNTKKVIKEIQYLFDKFPNNRFIITCRIAAKEYIFENFTEVEIADFDQKQIESFVTNWFRAKNLQLTKEFLKQLKINQPIQELASNPLLLTLLCLEFEESGDFPNERGELYKRAIDTLLRKWDSKRGIQRDIVYKQLSVQRKEILLTEIAFKTFKEENYLLKQSNLEKLITDYIQNLPDAQTDLETLRTDSQAVLKSIEAQHGLLVEQAKNIYSFSHLTFHEYFTAKYIVDHANTENIEDLVLKELVWHIFFKNWREVFLLTSEMITKADAMVLRMKYCLDLFASKSRVLQQLLAWANQKSQNISNSDYSPVAIRAFYICLAVGVYILDKSNYPFGMYWNIINISDLLETIEPKLGLNFYEGCASGFGLGHDKGCIDDENLALDFYLSHARCHFSLLGRIANENRETDVESITLNYEQDEEEVDQFMQKEHPLDDTNFYELAESLYSAIEISTNFNNEELKEKLLILNNKLPEGVYDKWDEYYKWYKNESANSGNQLKEINKQYRNLDYDWQFEDQEWGNLIAYCYGNKLLLDCLNKSYVSKEIREHIWNNLLIPFDEIS